MQDDPALQCCNSVVTIRNNVATILQQVATPCCAKNLHYESSRVTPYNDPFQIAGCAARFSDK